MPRTKAAHTTFYRRKRVLLALRDGQMVVDRYLDSRSRFLIFEQLGRVRRSDINSITIYRDKA